MSERLVNTFRIPAAGPRMTMEIQVVDPPRPARWRLRIALWLVRVAGRMAKMRVRVVDQSDR